MTEEEENEPYVPIIFPVVLMALAMFVVGHGPHNWPEFWRDLINTPQDARHAQRSGTRANFYAPFNSGPRPLFTLKMQYLAYARAVEQSLANQLKEDKSREVLIKSFFNTISLNATHITTMTKMIKTCSLNTLDAHRKRILSYAKQFPDKNVRRPFVAKIQEFFGHFETVVAGRDHFG